MATYVEHLFMNLLATCISSIVKCLRLFAHFLTGLFLFLLLSLEYSLHILATSLWPDNVICK